MLALRDELKVAKTYKLKNILRRVGEPVKVEATKKYTQIGIRSHGKGIFIKEPVSGLELGNKRVFWVEPDCFIVNIVFAWERAVSRTTDALVGYIASHRFPMYKVDKDLVNLDYFTKYFQTKKGKSLLELASPGGAGRNKTLGQKEFLDLEITIPNLEIQNYISSFIKLLDSKIQIQQEKVELLKQQKKELMQKIFKQEIRFKDENGEEYSEWETFELNKLGTFGKTYSYSRAVEGEGTYSYIHYGDIHSNYPTVCKDVHFPTIMEVLDYELVCENDIIFADASEDYADLGKAILVKNTLNQHVIAGLHTHKFTPNEKLDSLYFIYFTQSRHYEKFIKRMGTGVSVLGISKTNLNKLKVPLPSIEEQEKIGKTLYLLDQRIQNESNKTKLMEERKQGFMQQMFIY
ncbi:restriction endonuclease subunit S [Priestia megaterium]|uniref:restriction endonuclease subunit S n=1 Tax=Priestia megaterium TaxID=1404 RepID=UPI0025A3F385|nr:restriction endonuclease subunit S [Priestia megaterium]MDM8151044.1 restriction endonuclease subunit S [Priestia megaterium]